MANIQAPWGHGFERFAQRANAWTERWMPDAFVFALAATLVTLVAAWAVDPAMRRSPLALVDAWGSGFWTLIPFTLQMSMMLIGGYVLASSPPVFRLIGRIASWPRTAKGAVLLVAIVSMTTSLLNWGFSLIGAAILAREVGRRMRTIRRSRPAAFSAFVLCGRKASAVHPHCRWRGRRRCRRDCFKSRVRSL